MPVTGGNVVFNLFTSRFFGIELIKIYLISSNVSKFENAKMCQITPPYCTVQTKYKLYSWFTKFEETDSQL